MPLILDEQSSPFVRSQLEADAAVTTWWGTETECVSAITRRERRGEMGADEAVRALAELDEVRLDWSEIGPSQTLRETARRVLRAYDLRAPDALQLAAGVAGSEGRPSTLPFVTLDERLADAASREGFPVVSF